jgi:hypothetical protein
MGGGSVPGGAEWESVPSPCMSPLNSWTAITEHDGCRVLARLEPDDPAYAHLAEGVQDFESNDTEGGRAATDWLKYHSLANHPWTVTRLVVRAGLVEGFYALCSAEVRLTQRHRKELEEDDENTHRLHPRQGASLIAWVAKHREATVPGELILLHAAWIATKVATLQGNILLTVDSFDESTAEFWQEHYGFRQSRSADEGGLLRLWLPLTL